MDDSEYVSEDMTKAASMSPKMNDVANDFPLPKRQCVSPGDFFWEGYPALDINEEDQITDKATVIISIEKFNSWFTKEKKQWSLETVADLFYVSLRYEGNCLDVDEARDYYEVYLQLLYDLICQVDLLQVYKDNADSDEIIEWGNEFTTKLYDWKVLVEYIMDLFDDCFHTPGRSSCQMDDMPLDLLKHIRITKEQSKNINMVFAHEIKIWEQWVYCAQCNDGGFDPVDFEIRIAMYKNDNYGNSSTGGFCNSIYHHLPH